MPRAHNGFMSAPRAPKGRKLLVASLGVAAISYVACKSETSGNLVAPDNYDSSVEDSPVANLVAPPPADAHSSDVAEDVVEDWAVANLVAPPPADAGDGG